MSITCKTDSGGLVSKLRKIDRNRPEARRLAAIEMARDVARVAVIIAPKDTYRYINGVAQAANTPPISAGINVPRIQPSRVHDEIVRKLHKQVAFWEYIIRDYVAKGRTHYKGTGRSKGKTGETKGFLKAKRAYERAKEQLAKVDATSIAIGLRGKSTGLVNLTVRNKIYGGEGTVIETPATTFVKLHNKEAHASIVEHLFGVMRKALSVAKAVGAKKANAVYLKKCTAGTDAKAA